MTNKFVIKKHQVQINIATMSYLKCLSFNYSEPDDDDEIDAILGTEPPVV